MTGMRIWNRVIRETDDKEGDLEQGNYRERDGNKDYRDG